MISENYKIRAALAYISGICVEIKFFEDIFQRLCKDKIVNVRVACGIVARKYKIDSFVEILANDLEKDVKESLYNQKNHCKNNDCVLIPCKYQYINHGFVIVFNNSEGNQEKNSFNGEQINKEIRLNKGYFEI
jgi:hypothetical protein